jgi:hypothetical protein
VAAVDFDGDGDSDLTFGRSGNPSDDLASDLVFLNNSSASVSFFLADRLGGSRTSDVLTGDFNGDGRNDIVSINAASSHKLFTESGAPNTAFLLHPEQFSSPAAAGAAAGRFNADDRVDIALAGADMVAIFLNDGRGNFGPGDAAAPTLTLNGASTVKITVGDEYADAGATATDELDGDLTDSIVVVNPVDPDLIGTYTVTYEVVDSFGNRAATLERTVEVAARSGSGGGGGGTLVLETALLLLGALAAALRAAQHGHRAAIFRTPGRAEHAAARFNRPEHGEHDNRSIGVNRNENTPLHDRRCAASRHRARDSL